jgi:hypothetical protein
LHGVSNVANQVKSPCFSFNQIRNLTGASIGFIKLAINNPSALSKRKCLCRNCPEDELTPEEVSYLCDETILE